jgi:hypothetical protein
LVRIFGARLVFGHDMGVVEELVREKKFYE